MCVNRFSATCTRFCEDFMAVIYLCVCVCVCVFVVRQ